MRFKIKFPESENFDQVVSALKLQLEEGECIPLENSRRRFVALVTNNEMKA